jgi:ABC-type nitrate/sulfonate/bicarbonate transport system substrate-binding protein
MEPLRTLAWLVASAAAAGIMMLALPDVTPPAAAADLQKVRLVYDWSTADFKLIPTAVAQAEGFYRAAGLAVSVLFPPDDSTTVRMLATDQGISASMP